VADRVIRWIFIGVDIKILVTLITLGQCVIWWWRFLCRAARHTGLCSCMYNSLIQQQIHTVILITNSCLIFLSLFTARTFYFFPIISSLMCITQLLLQYQINHSNSKSSQPVAEVGRYGLVWHTGSSLAGLNCTTTPLLSDNCQTQKQFCCHQTRFLGLKCLLNVHTFAAGALSQTPLGELTALPQIP